MRNCGTSPRYMLVICASSGTSAARRCISSTTWEMRALPRLLMSSSCISRPELAPSPGMAGGFTLNTTASCTDADSSSTRRMTASTELSAPRLWFHGFSTTNSDATLLLLPPPTNDVPLTAITSFTCGSSRICRARRMVTLSVRSSEAPSGSCRLVMK